MKIHNVRLGFATNSSSTHSIVFLKPKHRGTITDSEVGGAEFGWNYWTAASTASKRQYVAIQLFDALRHQVNVDVAEAVVDAWMPGCEKNTEDPGPMGNVDHQSSYVLPSSWDGRGVNKAFFQEFAAFFQRDDVVLLGGNDNDDQTHPLASSSQTSCGFVLPLPRDGGSELVARKDPKGYWTVFDRTSGAKVRFSFADPTSKKEVTKATAPELIDLKITDHCPFGCHFCVDPATPVLCADMTWRPIGELHEGDKLIAFDEMTKPGTKDRRIRRPVLVEKVWEVQKPAVRITTDLGSVTCALDHRWLMSHTHRWLETRNLKLGHRIMFTAAPWGDVKETDGYKRGYLSGISCGDGTSHWEKEPGRRQVYWSVRMTDEVAVRRAAKYVADLGIDVPEVSTYQPDGVKVDGTPYGMMFRLEARAKEALTTLRDIIWLDENTEDQDYRRGWLAGFFDAEGSLGAVLRLSQKKTDLFLDTAERWLQAFGFDCVKEHGSEVRLRGGRWEIMRFLALTRPAIERKWEAVFEGGLKNRPAMVLKLEMLPEQRLIDIQTSTRTFIANGFASHNCYQGSTHEGKHADTSALNSLAYMFGQMQVFEVAIGGGEPTLHPDFINILTMFRHYGVIPNFTTKNLAWLRDPTVWPKVVKVVGGFAYSVDKADDVRKLAMLLKFNEIDSAKANIQYVMGTSSLYDLENIIREAAEANLRITLLGYKLTGRGSSFKPQSYKGWIDTVAKLHKDKVYFNLGIDTLLAQESGAALKKAGVHTTLYETFEGRFSMYLDAVDMKMGPSSYCDDLAMKRVEKFGEKDILGAFAGYGKTSWEKLDSLDG